MKLAPPRLSRRHFVWGTAAAATSGLWGCAARQPFVTRAMLGTPPATRALPVAPLATAASAPFEAAASAVPLVDVHCHTFNVRDLPLHGFVRGVLAGGIAGNVGIPDDILRHLDGTLQRISAKLIAHTPSDAADEEDLTSCLKSAAPLPLPTQARSLRELLAPELTGQDRLWRLLEQILPVLEVATQGRRAVAATLLRNYPAVQLFTPALVDYGYWTDTYEHNALKKKDVLPASTDLCSQLRLHALVSAASLQGNLVPGSRAALHPFAPFNPLREVREASLLPRNRRKTPLALVREAIEVQGYIGVKLYPASGFLPYGNGRIGRFWERGTSSVGAHLAPGKTVGVLLDAALAQLYDYCEKNEVPILAHATRSNGFGSGESWRGTPWGWAEVLEKWPKLRVNLGHFGELEGVGDDYQEGATVLDCIAWSRHAATLMGKYSGLYADLSFSELGFEPDAADQYLRYFRSELLPVSDGLVLSRTMYGTDWWLTQLLRPLAPPAGYLSSFQESLKRGGLERALPGMMGENALRFLGFWDEAGKPATNNRNWQRLNDHYARLGVRAPDWLSKGRPT